MGDLINRQAAIDALEREKSLVERPITETRWFDFGLRKAQDVLSELPSAQPEPRWILVSEKPPENAGVYLVTNHKGDVVRYTFNNSKTSKDYWKRCVTAWMPIPEPYKAGSGVEG